VIILGHTNPVHAPPSYFCSIHFTLLTYFQRVSSSLKLFWTSRNTCKFLEGVVSASPNQKCGGPPLVSCPGVLIQHIRSCAQYLQFVFSIQIAFREWLQILWAAPKLCVQLQFVVYSWLTLVYGSVFLILKFMVDMCSLHSAEYGRSCLRRGRCHVLENSTPPPPRFLVPKFVADWPCP
jgi:hypothetical protein